MKYLGGKIYQGDCLEVMKKLPNESVDMILCDLPYGTTQNKWDSIIPLDKLWAEYRRIIKPKGVIALSSQGIFTARLTLSNESWFRYKFVWVKSKPTNFLNARRQPLRQHEDICIFYGSQPNYRPVMSKGEPYDKGTRKAQYTGSYGDFKPVQVKSDGERFPTDTLYCKTAESEAGCRVWHPTQKPVALGRYLIRMFTGEGDVVLDNAFGSGSFLVAAALEGRRFIGIEKNEEVHLFKEKRIDYIKVAKQRLAEVEEAMKSKQLPPPLFSALQPAARAGQPNRRGMVDVDEVIREAQKESRMTNIPATYNERSWAIDLIGHLKQLSAQNNRSIKDAGGEQTIRVDGGSLFPDVLLFGDRATARILQGWELKMPDTQINNYEFKRNAEIKARALGLDSFILWNVSHAHLYVRNAARDIFELSHEWADLNDITTRQGVSANRQRWEAVAADIFLYLNDLFDRGTLEGRQFIEAYRSGGITSLIMENAEEVAIALTNATRRNAGLRAEMILWWDRYKAEYGQGTMEQVLAKAIISNWIGKILFAHILREQDQRAQQVATIHDTTTPEQALELFGQLSESCNFWTIFSSEGIGLALIPERAWSQLKQFNHLLNDLRVGSVDQAQLSGILEATVEVATRKLRGQYPTPIELARLLVNLCVQDTVNDRVLDPCCGSGTIPRAALEQKLAAGVSAEQASQSIFAGDQDPQAIQIATFALAKPAMMHMPLRIFQRDAFTLSPELEITFRNPTNGTVFSETLGNFQAITSNLPFVAQEGRRQYGNAIERVTAAMGGAFAGRADVSAYLPFALCSLLSVGGRLGIIITNAWLGTDWGDAFYRHLGRYYDLKSVVTSGAGRWFQNSEVVTNILIMEKKADHGQPSGDVKFVVLTRPLEEMADDEAVQIAAAQIELGQTQNDTMTIHAVSPADLERFRQLGLGGNAQFVNCDWVLDLPLRRLNDVFQIRRGERRGNNELFYPATGHGIEDEYIRPLAKSPSDFRRLSGAAAKQAFSCSRTEEELEANGHTGALAWIRRFKTTGNIERLSRTNQYWYEMRADTLTDLVLFINYGQRLFVGRVDPPAFADQRLVRLDPRQEVDIELYHALLNSTISMFIIEGMGFGRGLGALDLNKDRIENFMHVLDPDQLDQSGIDSIKVAFTSLLNREILDIADELDQADRQAFDDAVIVAFGLNIDRQQLYDCLLSLVEIRMTANS